MVDVTTEITIRRSVGEVCVYAAEPSNAPHWYDNIKSAAWTTDPPLRVGSKFAFTAIFLRRQLTYTYEVIDFVPNERLTMRTAEGPFPMETTYTWLRIDDRTTLMTLRNHGDPSGFSKLASPIMRAAMRHANRKDLAKLKSNLETTA